MDVGVVLKGYDPVACFTEGKAAKGNPEIKAALAKNPAGVIAKADASWPALNP